MIQTAARWHLLPQSYLFGLADVGFTADYSHSYLLGTVYPHGVWPYFPVAFAIKTTLGLLVLLVLVPLCLARSRIESWRELLFLIVPAAIYFGVAMASGMNIGVRHILPVYPFLMCSVGSLETHPASAALGRCCGAPARVECRVVDAHIPSVSGVFE